MTSVLIADDQALVRVGLRKILEAEPDIEVVGEAGDGEDAVADGPASAARPRADGHPHARAGRDRGDQADRRARTRDARPDPDHLRPRRYVYDALRAGASGFMLKDAPPEEIVGAVRIVARGEALLAPAVTRSVIEEFARQRPAAPRRAACAVAELTPREREVLDLLARDFEPRDLRAPRGHRGDGEDARRPHPAEAGLRDRIQAVIYAYETGLVSPGQDTT